MNRVVDLQLSWSIMNLIVIFIKFILNFYGWLWPLYTQSWMCWSFSQSIVKLHSDHEIWSRLDDAIATFHDQHTAFVIKLTFCIHIFMEVAVTRLFKMKSMVVLHLKYINKQIKLKIWLIINTKGWALAKVSQIHRQKSNVYVNSSHSNWVNISSTRNAVLQL